MTYAFAPGVRDRTSLIIMIAGASGSGKTRSALALARGLAGGDDSRVGIIDSESGRALHYAPARNEKPGPDRFAFQHLDLRAPFTPENYIDAINAANAAGFEVIIGDSMSHEWDGDGGLHDIHEEITAQAVERQRQEAIERNWRFDEALARDKASIASWGVPKMRHKKFVGKLLQSRAHLVLLFRADEKMRMETVDAESSNGRKYKKTVITAPKDLPPAERWQPICERRLPYEMTISLLLTPDRPGVPIPLKLQAQHMHAFPEGRQISESTGAALAEWAKGGAPGATGRDYAAEAQAKAREGTEAFRAWWPTLPSGERARLKPRLSEFQRIAESAASDKAGVSSLSPPASEGSEVHRRPDLSALLADLTATGDARAAAGIGALEDFLGGLTEAESALISADQRQAWLAVAARGGGER